MKKVVSALVAICLCLSCFTACSNAQQNSSKKPESSKSTASGKVSSETSVEKAKVVFWDLAWGQDDYLNAAEKLVEQFNEEHSDIVLEYQAIPWDGYLQNFTTAIASDAGPDMSTGGGSMQHLFATMGEILTLDPIIEAWEREGTLDDIDPIALSLIRYDGKQIGIPWQFDPRMMWYNTELFEQAGITELPANLDEFKAALQKLQGSGVKNPFVLDGKGGYEALSFWQSIAFEFGGGMVEDGKVIVDSAESKQAFSYIKDLMENGLIPQDVAGWSADDAKTQFLQGNAGVIWGTGDIKVQAQQQAADMADKLAILPRITSLTINPANSIMGYNKTENKEATLEAIKWWSENELPLFTDGKLGKIPARKSFMEDPAVVGTGSNQEIIEKIVPNSVGNGYPNSELFPQYQTIMGDLLITNAFQELLLTETSVDNVAAKAKEEIEAIMEAK